MVRRVFRVVVTVWFFFQVNHFGVDVNGVRWYVDDRFQGVCQVVMHHCEYEVHFVLSRRRASSRGCRQDAR
jgi:hypothetical protein